MNKDVVKVQLLGVWSIRGEFWPVAWDTHHSIRGVNVVVLPGLSAAVLLVLLAVLLLLVLLHGGGARLRGLCGPEEPGQR